MFSSSFQAMSALSFADGMCERSTFTDHTTFSQRNSSIIQTTSHPLCQACCTPSKRRQTEHTRKIFRRNSHTRASNSSVLSVQVSLQGALVCIFVHTNAQFTSQNLHLEDSKPFDDSVDRNGFLRFEMKLRQRYSYIMELGHGYPIP